MSFSCLLVDMTCVPLVGIMRMSSSFKRIIWEALVMADASGKRDRAFDFGYKEKHGPGLRSFRLSRNCSE